ncbi:MAG: DUF4430 domain-containing protein [Halothermotrichaceae bacterium]
MDKSIKNKILIIMLVVIIAGLGLFAYQRYLAPQSVAGQKTVTLEVIIDNQDINKAMDYNTDHEFLYELLKENEKELGVSFKESDFGAMLVGLMDYTADTGENEFFNISVNGKDAEVGVEELPIKDGDIYKIELKTW